MSTRREWIKKGVAAGAAVTVGAGLASAVGCSSEKEGVLGGSSPTSPKQSPKFKWKMITTWPKNFPGLGTGANKLAQSIYELTDGSIDIKVYGAGEIVPALEVFDAVQRGTAEVGHGVSFYWQGKHEAASFFAAMPFGLTAQEMNAWLYYGDGQKLWDELYAPFGVKAFCSGNTGVQMGGWFNREIKTLNDFKGLKMRMPGLGGKVISQLGSAVVTLSGGEIFQALKTGTIDATEWVGPYNDMTMGLHKAAKFYYWPGWHEPGTAIEALFNKKALAQLTKKQLLAVEYACRYANQDMLSEYMLKNTEALKILIDKEKVQIRKFPDEALKKLHDISNQLTLDISKKDKVSRKIYRSYQKILKASSEWNKISEGGYALARSL